MGFCFKPLDYASMAGFLAYSSSVTALPICLVHLSRDLGMSLAQAGSLGLGKGILVLVTLLFSGFIAARFGKVRSIGVACIVLGGGMLVYSLAPSYGALFLAVALLGVGGGVVEALINPLVQELHAKDSGRYLNVINAFWSIGVLATMLGSGEALSEGVSWRTVMGSLGGVSFLSGALFLVLREAGDRPRGQVMSTVLAGKRKILRLRRFWLFSGVMFLGGAAEGAFTYWSASFLQLEHGMEPRAAGVGAALFAGGMIVARLLWGWLIPQERLWGLLLGSAIGGLGIGVIFPLTELPQGVYLNLFIAGFAVASFWPSLQSYAVDRMDCDATSAFILLSCGGIVGFSSVSWTMGVVGDWVGLKASFWMVPCYLALMVGLLLVERRWRVE